MSLFGQHVLQIGAKTLLLALYCHLLGSRDVLGYVTIQAYCLQCWLTFL